MTMKIVASIQYTLRAYLVPLPSCPEPRPATDVLDRTDALEDHSWEHLETKAKAIKNAGNVSPNQEKDIRRAEEQAKQRAKDHDPAEMSGHADASTREGTDREDSSRNSRPSH